MSLRDKFSGGTKPGPKKTPAPISKPLSKQTRVQPIQPEIMTAQPIPQKTVITQERRVGGNAVEQKMDIIHRLNEVLQAQQEGEAKDSQMDRTDLIEILVFEINRELYAFETRFVSEILELMHITPVPTTKDFLLGLINLRNDIISVLDLDRLFLERFTDVNEKNRILILHQGPLTTGIMVNKIVSISYVPMESIVHNVESLNLKYQNFVRNIIRLDEKDILIVDCEKLFTDTEFEKIRV